MIHSDEQLELFPGQTVSSYDLMVRCKDRANLWAYEFCKTAKELGYDIDDLSQTFSGGKVYKDASKINQRADIKLLPSHLRPNNNLLRVQTDAVDSSLQQRHRPMQTYSKQLVRVGKEMGDNFYSQSAGISSSGQVKNDIFRGTALRKQSDNPTPWRGEKIFKECRILIH